MDIKIHGTVLYSVHESEVISRPCLVITCLQLGDFVLRHEAKLSRSSQAIAQPHNDGK
jgi:hypothetical protein